MLRLIRQSQRIELQRSRTFAKTVKHQSTGRVWLPIQARISRSLS